MSQFARLWRGVWWAQPLATLLALVVGSVLLGAAVDCHSGGLETLANAIISDTLGPGNLDGARREEAMKIADRARPPPERAGRGRRYSDLGEIVSLSQ